ncbi:derlin-2 protein (macronuclear) [Tetrahymena thermophila SB210]|uniref:Derlin n=1 Tax=Tetrahymena thermophila (strain SB210) TaxID=312017 RepID=Q247T1_TETTS|nr:derlin-2 protein [Tetrahymena thermophila SB210]EAS04019.3 derlin-2 protein [Tetrahymena thermophila SB210]|eukprot:XP_001024264.3 derlin-2 protein [Tetrahymena thermophila SB210]
MEDFKTWYFQFPVVSRSFITAVVAVTVVASLIYSPLPYYMYLDFQKLKNFQIWRIFTNFFFLGTFGPNIIWDLVYLYFATTRLDSLFTDRQVDEQLWLYIVVMTFLSIAGLIFSTPFLCSTLLFAFIYIWCKRQPFETVQFFFGLKFKSGYFPYILMGLHLILGQSIISDLIGVAAGHGYVFFKYIYPVSSGKDFLRTPRFFTSFVNKYISKTQAHNYQNPNNQQQNNQGQQGFNFRQFQGQGVRIG